MSILSKRDVERFTPPGHESDATPPVYLIAPLTWRERPAWSSAHTRERAFYHTDQALVDAVRNAVEEVNPDNAAELLATIDEFRASLDANQAQQTSEPAEADAEGQPTDNSAADARAKYAVIERAMRDHYAVSAMLADRQLFMNVAPILAAAYALRGWENVSAKFERRGGVVTDEALEALPAADLAAVGLKAITMMKLSGPEQKN